MASMSSHSLGASSSLSFSLTGDRWLYDVFLSFRDKDTRNTFTAHLYTALHQKGINTFIDDEELRRGEEISPSFLKAIEDSRISIIVFSENYVSSSWCLDELLKILQCKETIKQRVLPVFYYIDPSDVRHQKNNFGKALAKLEDKITNDLKMQRWRAALHDTTNLSGWHLEINRNESNFVQSIVEEVLRIIVNCTHLDVAKYPVGIESRAQDINLLLSIGMNDMRMVGIIGIGGVGKTTIAKAIYNLVADQFECSCFLANVRETSKREYGLVQLQETMLFEILGDTSLKILNADRGICVIKKRLSYKKVLLVLDDVDQLVQLDALAGSRDWFGLGSRIIITTRDKRLLTSHEVDLTYKMKELDFHEALQLFSWYAFKGKKPIDDYAKLTEGVISYVGGLPLALMVLGSDLCDRSIQHWKSALDKYKRIPNKSIQEILKVSFDGLDDKEKDIFLDVACFFKGERVDDVTKILESCGFVPDNCIRVLIDFFFISKKRTKSKNNNGLAERSRPTQPGAKKTPKRKRKPNTQNQRNQTTAMAKPQKKNSSRKKRKRTTPENKEAKPERKHTATQPNQQQQETRKHYSRITPSTKTTEKCPAAGGEKGPSATHTTKGETNRQYLSTSWGCMTWCKKWVGKLSEKNHPKNLAKQQVVVS